MSMPRLEQKPEIDETIAAAVADDLGELVDKSGAVGADRGDGDVLVH